MALGHYSTFKDMELSKLLNPGKWSLKARILVVSATFLLMGITALGVFVSHTLESSFEKSVSEHLSLLEESVRNDLRRGEEVLLALVSSMSAIPDVARHLAAQDRNSLMSYVLPYVDRVRNSTGYQSLFFHFHVLPGISFLRSWNVDEWQDDLSKTRSMVSRANKAFTPLAGIERGHKGHSLRAIIPVMNGTEHIGSVEAGLTLEEIFQSLHFPAHYGAAMILQDTASDESEKPASIAAERSGPVIRIAGSVDMKTAQMLAADERDSGHHGSLDFIRLPLSDFQGRSIGSIFLFFDDYQLFQDKRARFNSFVWLAMVGSIAMWCFLYVHVMKVGSFINQLKRVVLTAQSSNFTSRFKTDHIHCREILQCEQESCPVYSKPYLICHLEAGCEAALAESYKTCGFLGKYKKCSSCPVYKANRRDELTEAKWLVNTFMRVLNLFLLNSTRMFSEVFGIRTTGQSLSLEDISKHQEHMSHIAGFSRDLRGVLNKAEAYRLLNSIFEKSFKLDDYVLMEVDSSENRMQVVTGALRCSSAGGEDVLGCSTLCRTNRVAETVCSLVNDVLCPFFNCDISKEFRACLPMVMGGRVGAVFSFVAPVEKGPFWRDMMFVLRRYLDVAAPVLSSMRLLDLTREQALRDPLTHCHNRRFLDEYIQQYELLSQRHEKKVGFLMADLDYFKQVNDQYGHQTGDAVLRQVAALLRENIRKSDLLIRYGGEEFLVLLLEIASGAADEIAEKIRRAVEEYRFGLPGGIAIQKTISIGISEYPGDADMFYKAIKYADVALYEAKQAGRNRVVRFEPGMWTNEDY